MDLGLVVLLGKDVDGGFDQRVAAVVIEQAARNLFELLIADDFGILRSDFVAHSISIDWIRFINFDIVVSLLSVGSILSSDQSSSRHQ
jgi:hypothetical protein